MKLTTIWTMPAMSLRERVRRTGEWALIAAAHHMPRELQFRTFCAVVSRYSFAHPKAEVPAITVEDVLKEWGR